MTSRQSVTNTAPALVRGVSILDEVACNPDKLTVAQLSRNLNLAKSSVHGLCLALVDNGLLFKNSNHTFAIGPHVMRWAKAFKTRSDIATEFSQIWDEVTLLPGSTVTLSVHEGLEVVYLAARNSGLTPWMNFRVGMRLPVAFTATGNVFLSYLPDMKIRQMFSNSFPEPMSRESVRDIEALLDRVHDTRRTGVAIDRGQVSELMVCYGAPVIGPDDTPIAGIAVSLPIDDVTPEQEKQILDSLQRMSHTMSIRLGADISSLRLTV
ncbi:IclR family transcriptional regulator [Halomonas sp. H2]|uniref:IclR family transcriptional regulator n=1 Tax=Halomonas sp. H2 TaxID=261936 RepID=UPI003CEF0E0D